MAFIIEQGEFDPDFRVPHLRRRQCPIALAMEWPATNTIKLMGKEGAQAGN